MARSWKQRDFQKKKKGDSLKNNYRTSNVAIPVWLFTQSFLRSPDPFLSGKYNAK